MLLIRAMVTASFSQSFLSRWSTWLWLGPRGGHSEGALPQHPIWMPPRCSWALLCMTQKLCAIPGALRTALAPPTHPSLPAPPASRLLRWVN